MRIHFLAYAGLTAAHIAISVILAKEGFVAEALCTLAAAKGYAALLYRCHARRGDHPAGRRWKRGKAPITPAG